MKWFNLGIQKRGSVQCRRKYELISRIRDVLIVSSGAVTKNFVN